MPAIFEVPPDMLPGVFRAGYGFFEPGQQFQWPDDAEPGDNPSLKLIPCNEEAENLLFERRSYLVSVHGALAVDSMYGPAPDADAPKAEVKPAPKPPVEIDQEAIKPPPPPLPKKKGKGRGKGKAKRASDSK